MDWPISWQKVKDNGGFELFDLADYGLNLNDGTTQPTTDILTDIYAKVKENKIIYLKGTMDGFDGFIMGPIASFHVIDDELIYIYASSTATISGNVFNISVTLQVSGTGVIVKSYPTLWTPMD